MRKPPGSHHAIGMNCGLREASEVRVHLTTLENTRNMKSSTIRIVATVLFIMCATRTVSQAADDPQERVRSVVETAIRPVMEKARIPGMAVGIIVAGKTYMFSYGVTST